MELPAALRQAIDEQLAGVPLSELRNAAELLSSRYRAKLRDGRAHLNDALAVKAYLAARLPATYAAIRDSFSAVADAMPDVSPASLLDIGAGPGTALWAAADCWPGLSKATLLEASPAARAAGEALTAAMPLLGKRWLAADITRPLPDVDAAELVVLSYVLDELAPDEREPLIARLWGLTAGAIVIVEPGTPAGWSRILDARRWLAAAGANLLAPCAHAGPCPLAPPDWCHFARRVTRSRLHRLAKGGDVPWEDEKYIFIAAARHPGAPAARVLAPPRTGKGMVRLKLCERDGVARERIVSKRDGEAFRIARRLGWGDPARF